ncbi:MAG: hypothetical protein PVG20_02950 [Thioalkalispiraceae bacterium]
MNSTENATVKKSSFVTILAWIFIVLAGFATFISIMQNIMINMVFPLDEMQQQINSPEAQANIPNFASFMFSHLRLFFFSFLVVSSSTLIAAIGLLRRKNWARILFIVMMSFGIAWNLGGLILQQFMFSNMPHMNGSQPVQFDVFVNVIRVFSFLMALAVSILFGWIIKRLVSPAIKQEFL